MKPPKSRKAELGPNASGGEKSHAETAESAEFKMTELGPIPVDWEVRRLGEICSEYAYGTGAESVDYDGKNKYIRITDIDEDSHLYSPSTLVSPSFFSEWHIVKDNDLLVARTGASVGKTYFYSKRDGKLIFAGFLMKANVKHAEGKFIFYWTLTDYYKRWVLSESARSGQPGINIRQLQSLLLPLPPLAEQQRIASALSDVDELISALGKLIEKKRNIKTGAMQELLTGKTRLSGFGAKRVEFKHTELDPIPVDWEVKRLGEIAEICTGKRNGDEQVENGIYPFFVRSSSVYRINTFSYEGEAILIPGEGGIGDIFHYINGRFDFHQRVYKVSDFATGICAKYIYYCMRMFFSGWAHSQTVKATVDSLRLPTFELFQVRIPPTLAEQKAIAAVLSDMDAEIAALEADRAKYERIKSGMMQELLTGKTRLKGE